MRVRFSTAAPVTDHLDTFERELAALSQLARTAHPETHYQIEWPAGGDNLEDYAFLFKRAAVAVSGAQTDARVVTRPLPPLVETLDALYSHEIAAYADGPTGPKLLDVDQAMLQRSVNEKDNSPSGPLADEFVRNFVQQEPIPGIVYEFGLIQRFLPVARPPESAGP